MATTSVDSTRPSGQRGIELYTDAIFIRDDIKLYFGDGGDMYLLYDSTSDALFIKGLPISNPAKSDALFISDVGGSDLRVSFG